MPIPPAVVAEGPLPKADQARGLAHERPTAPEDVGLLLPRILLFPPRLIVKAIAFPLREAAILVEKHSLIERADRFFYNDAHTIAVLPTFQFLSSQGPTIGLQAFHNNLAGHGERLEASVQTGGTFSQAYEVAFKADRTGGSRLYLESAFRYEVRPRLLFQGIGDDPRGTTEALAGPRDVAVQTRYGVDRLLLAQRGGYTIGEPGNLVKLGGAAIFNARSFTEPTPASFALLDGGTDTPTQSVYDTRRITGFNEGVRTLELSATLLVDTRDTEGRTSSGSYLDMFAGGVPPLNKYRYAHYGIDAATFIDLYRKTRVLVLRVGVDAVEGSYDRIPFTDLPRLGGPTRLRGYRLDRFRDEKAALATVEYQYPVHKNVSGALFVDAGHVDYNYPRLFDLREWRTGLGAGLRVHSADSTLFAFDVAYGEGVRIFFTTTPFRAFQNRERQL